jgi:hypothetical protein
MSSVLSGDSNRGGAIFLFLLVAVAEHKEMRFQEVGLPLATGPAPAIRWPKAGVQHLLAITRKRRNLNICRCLAAGPSFRYGQFSPALHKSKSSGFA